MQMISTNKKSIHSVPNLKEHFGNVKMSSAEIEKSYRLYAEDLETYRKAGYINPHLMNVIR